MFSVDNFYDFMNSHYGFNADDRNILYFFQPHGSKHWKDLVALMQVDERSCILEDSVKIKAHANIAGGIILHDQEPFAVDMLNTYKWWLIQERNQDWRIDQPLMDLSLCPQIKLGWQIFCHSEHHSEDVVFAEQAGSISCHYFYHGLISRDWFRHWKHHGLIRPSKNWQHRFLLYARECTGTRQYRAQLLEDLLPFQSIIDHDWQKSRNIAADASARISVSDAQTSAIHLVAETIFDRDKVHLTEKTFKPMVMMQPFIVFGGAGSLQYLKRYGFHTFDSIWDESYDLEKDHHTRYQKILDLIRYLASVSDTALDDILAKCKPIIEHNHQVFFSEKFETQLLTELHTNMAHCLEQQAEKTQRYPGGVIVNQFDLLRQRGKPIPDHLKQDFTGMMSLLQTQDNQRYHNILKQYHWLRDCLV